jgi:hypothetical protein
MYNKKYLSKRPFMLVYNSYRPAQGANTAKPGWADLNGGQWSVYESINFVDRVKEKDLIRAVVVIDVMEATVVKNGFPDIKADDLMKHYLSKYRKETTEAVGIWVEQQAQERARKGLPALDLTSDAPAVEIAPEDLAQSVAAVIKQTGGTDETVERALGTTAEVAQVVEAEPIAEAKPKRKAKAKAE